MKKLVLLFVFFISVLSAEQINAQVSRSALITDSDYRPGIQYMWGVGGCSSIPLFNERTYLGLEASFSLGSFENKFNLEFIFRPTFQLYDSYDYSVEEYGVDTGMICPFLIAPRYNVCRVSTNNFYFYLQPEVGVANLAGTVYGGRIGFGFKPLGTIYYEALGCSNVMGEGFYETNTLFITVGYSLNLW